MRLDECLDILDAPGRGMRTELNRVWKLPGFDSGPPRRFAYWVDSENLWQPHKPKVGYKLPLAGWIFRWLQLDATGCFCSHALIIGVNINDVCNPDADETGGI